MMTYIYIYASKVGGDPKVPFSISTTPRCRGGSYSISWIAPLYPWSVPYNVLNTTASSTIFKVFGMTRLGTEPRSPGSLANTLLIRAMNHDKNYLHLLQ